MIVSSVSVAGSTYEGVMVNIADTSSCVNVRVSGWAVACETTRQQAMPMATTLRWMFV